MINVIPAEKKHSNSKLVQDKPIIAVSLAFAEIDSIVSQFTLKGSTHTLR